MFLPIICTLRFICLATVTLRPSPSPHSIIGLFAVSTAFAIVYMRFGLRPKTEEEQANSLKEEVDMLREEARKKDEKLKKRIMDMARGNVKPRDIDI